jgi:hypothetical protein
MQRKFFILLLTISISFSSLAQDARMFGWRIHLSYNSVISLTEGPELIYIGSDVGFYSFHKISGELRVYSKVDGFSDVLVRQIKYNTSNNSLLIAYENGNIDILKDGKITNIRDVLNANIIGLKQINGITFKNDLAYLACSFGIVVLDMENMEVKDSYVKLSENGDKDLAVYSVELFQDHIYAATSLGLIRAPLDGSNLSNFASWDHTFKTVTNHSDHLKMFNGRLYADLDSILQVFDGNSWQAFDGLNAKLTKNIHVNHEKLVITQQVYKANPGGVLIVDKAGVQEFQQENLANDGILDKQGNIWTGGSGTSLVKYDQARAWSSTKPNGPASNSSFNMAFFADELWVLAGGVTASWQPTFNSHSYYRFREEQWYNKGPEIDANGIYDMVSISGNESSGDIWIGTQGAGVVHYKHGTLVDHFTEANSPLEKSTDFLFTPGVAMDKAGNVWISNYDATDKILKVRTRDNKWNSFKLGFGVTRASEILIDDAGNKWIVNPNQNDVGIIVMKDLDGPLGSRIDVRKLTTGAKAGGLPSNVVRTIELDDAGEIWVGTDNGLAIFFNPTEIFKGGEDVDAKRKAIDDGNDIGYLLGSEVINDIKIDGANRKWIATNTGVWLVAEDGGSVIRHFTESNSPLLSNTVNCIGIDPRSGEVFFGTSIGIISYRSDASEGSDTHGDVVVYPNPIEEDYSGPLTVTGLPKDATVKITDIAGRMVYETIANGGTLVWDVKNFNGKRPSTGVYLIFTANEDDEDALVSKVLILN